MCQINYIMTLKKLTPREHYVHLLQLVQNRKRDVTFSLNAFIRFIRPHCKTVNVNNKIVYIRIKGSEYGLTIEVMPDNYYRCQRNFSQFLYELRAETTNEFLAKIIKHKLLMP